MTRPVPIVALDVPTAAAAYALLDRIGPPAEFVKVGLQLFTAEGPPVVRELRARGARVFLDLKLHDIPNTVAQAVRSAAALGVELLTVHASGGESMLRAAAGAAEGTGVQLLAVTVLTSLNHHELARAWGRESALVDAEAARLAALARECGIGAAVAAVREVPALRRAAGDDLRVLTPGIRLPGDDAGDQSRVATPGEAARLGATWIVLGRSVTAAADPRAALERAVRDMDDA